MKSLLLLLLGSCFLTACGKDFCALGFLGSCSQKGDNQNQQGTSGTLDFRPSLNGYYTLNVKMGQVLLLNVTGGTKKYYAAFEPNACGQVDAAVTTFAPLIPGDCTLTVSDSSADVQKVKQIIHITAVR